MTQHYQIFESANGFCGIGWGVDGISRFQLPSDNFAETERLMHRRMPEATAVEPPAEIIKAIVQAKAYFAGGAMDFTGLDLDLSGQGEVFQRIYAATRRLAWGTTTTYGALAQELELGAAGAWTIGQAMAKNPIPLIIPCHRVLAVGRKIGGFSAPGGAVSKLRMLELEGIQLPDTTPAQQSFSF